MGRSRKSWQECNKCKKKTRSLRLDAEGFVCYNCYKKTLRHTNIPDPIKTRIINKGYTFEEALKKEYIVVSSGNGWHCVFPQILAGYKFKIKLIKNDDHVL